MIEGIPILKPARVLKPIMSTIETLRAELDDFVECTLERAAPSPPRFSSSSLATIRKLVTASAATSSNPPKVRKSLRHNPVKQQVDSYEAVGLQYNLNLAQVQLSKLQFRGERNYQHDLEVLDSGNATSSMSSLVSSPDTPGQSEPHLSESGPIDDSFIGLPSVINKLEALRLLGVFQKSLGELHPILGSDQLQKETESLYLSSEIEHRRRATLNLDDEDFQIVILVISIALTIENGATCSSGRRLFQIAHKKVVDKIITPQSSVQGVALVLLKVRFPVSMLGAGG